MNDGTPLLLAIIGHLVGDYLLQNDWMAANKKLRTAEGAAAVSIHALLWTFSVCFFAGWWSHWIFLALFYTHLFQDSTNVVLWWMKLRWKDQSQFIKPPELYYPDGPAVRPGCGPWSVIVVDNVWHIVTLWAVWRFLT